MAPSPLGKACLTRQSYLAGARQVLRQAGVGWRWISLACTAGFEVDASGDLASKCAATGGTYPDSIPPRTAGAPHSCTGFGR